MAQKRSIPQSVRLDPSSSDPSILQPNIGFKSNIPASIGGGANAGYALIQASDYSGKWGQVDSEGIAAGAVDESHLSFSVTTDTELGAALQVALQDPIDASDVSFSGSGNIASLDVEGALHELDAEKVSLAGTETISGVKTFTNNIKITAQLNLTGSATQNTNYYYYYYTGAGGHTLTLAADPRYGPFFVYNEGSGALTIAAGAGDTVNGVASVSLPSGWGCAIFGVSTSASYCKFFTPATIPASSIVNTAAGNISSTDVQSAINELDTEKTSVGLAQSMIVADERDASEIGFTGSRDVTSLDVEGALIELDTKKTSVGVTQGMIVSENYQADDIEWSGGQYISGNDVETALSNIDSKMAGMFSACMYVANSGAPTNTDTAAFQRFGAGGGTTTWTSAWDYYPTGGTAQLDTAAATAKITCRKPGIYLCTAAVGFDGLADTNYAGVAIYINGAQGPTHEIRNGGAAVTRLRVSEFISLAAGDYIQLYAFQNKSATELYGVGNAYNNRISMTLIRPT